jgi:hypothetical protein
MDNWWHLPTNKYYLNDLAEAIANGQCLIVTPAAHSPSGLEHALCHLLTDHWDYQVTRLTLPEDTDNSPGTWLYEQLVHDLSPEKPRDLQSLSREPYLAGRVILLTCHVGTDPRPWLAFLEKAQAAFRICNAWDRPRILLCLLPGSAVALPAPDSSLSLRVYEPACHLHEMRYLAASLTGESRSNDLASELQLECAVQLGLWDVELCETFMRSPLEQVLSPLHLLREWASTRGWKREDHANSPADPRSRSQGWSGCHSGTHVWHSAWLALHERDREVQRRLWKAQNTVIFPYIEEMRVYWIEKTRHLLCPPFQTLTGLLNDPTELEIGQLFFFLRSKRHLLNREARTSIEWLRNARHHLAHLEPLSASFVRQAGSPLIVSS